MGEYGHAYDPENQTDIMAAQVCYDVVQVVVRQAELGRAEYRNLRLPQPDGYVDIASSNYSLTPDELTTVGFELSNLGYISPTELKLVADRYSDGKTKGLISVVEEGVRTLYSVSVDGNMNITYWRRVFMNTSDAEAPIDPATEQGFRAIRSLLVGLKLEAQHSDPAVDYEYLDALQRLVEAIHRNCC